MKNTFVKYGHDSRLYSGRVELYDFDTEFGAYTTNTSLHADRFASDVKFDFDCESATKRRDASRIKEGVHPWRYGCYK